jgi:hypothetical protein
MGDPRPPIRQELSRFLPDQRSIRAFEKLFDRIPADLTDIQEQIDVINAELDVINAEIDALQYDVYIVTANHTTAKNEVIICKNTGPITVTLNTSPEISERAIIKRRGVLVTVEGVVDEQTNYILEDYNASLELVYTVNGWYIV